jgi:hypothetical protein
MSKRVAERIRRRVTCELTVGGRSHRGIVVDISETGVFVQTEATPPPGVRLKVKFHAPDGSEFEVDACVARRQVAPPQLAGVVRGGLGIRVERPPEAYFKLLGLDEAAAANAARAPQGKRASQALRGVGAPPSTRGTEPKAAAAPATAPAPPAEDTRPEFRVRVKQTDGPRSRSLKVRAADPDEARKNALKELGRGWEILSVEAA